ncbi:MAG: hypothetical protein QF635_00900 [Candidatus Thalassarchaeaceae archaeon]|nr:hypothetical protein [Candidatus Thalassarchaeaceae archaeon]
MSNGGLLQKAMEFQEANDEIVATTVSDEKSGIINLGNSSMIGLVSGLLSVVLMWILSDPSIQSDFAFVLIVPILLAGVSFWFIWNAIDRKYAGPIAVVLILLLSSPFLAMSVTSSSITITESELSSDAQTIELTLRESGGLFGSSSGDAVISVTYDENEIWSISMPLSINLNDGIGKYGRLVLPIEEFYSGNAADDSRYVVTVDSGSSSDSFILNSGHLERTVDTTQNLAVGAMGQGNDCSGNKDSCVIGVGLKAWVGLQTNVGNPPAPLPHANFELTATLSKDGVTAISYPTVTVINGEATWDSMSGEYGSGSSVVGDFGSEIVLDGSVEDFAINMHFIPRDDWEESDFGCYEFTVSATQGPPWGDRTAHVSTTYYELAEFGSDDEHPQDTDESWTQVNSC